MGRSRKAAILGAVLLALVLLAILAGIVIGATDMLGAAAARPATDAGWPGAAGAFAGGR